MVEYGLLVALILLIGVAALRIMGATTTKPFCEVTGALMYAGGVNGGGEPVEWMIDNTSKKPLCWDNNLQDYLW